MMSHRFRRTLAAWTGAAALACFGPGALPALLPTAAAQEAAAQTDDERKADVAFADRLEGVALNDLGAAEQGGPGRDPALRRAVGLLQKAAELAPDEPRHLRRLADAALRLGDVETAKSALQTYYTKFDGGDQVALIQYLDLVFADLQRAEDRLAYIDRVLSAGNLPDEVKSHAAMLARRTHLDRGDDAAAADMLDRALSLNDLNPAALQARYAQVAADGTRADRLAALLDLLRAGPAQPGVMTAVGRELAEAGLTDLAVQWYRRATETAFALALRTPPQDYADYAALLLLNNEPQEAGGAAALLAEAQPNDAAALFLQLLAERQLGRDAGPESAPYRAARGGIVARLNALSALAAGQDVPEDPGRESPPDVAADVQALRAGGNADLAAAYADALGDYAWLQVYFAEQPADPAVLDALGQMLGEDGAAVARLRGWSALREGRADAAKVKLDAAAAAGDPLAELGVLVLDGGGRADPDAASDLLTENPTGVRGAILFDAVRDSGARVRPPESTEALRELLLDFPDDLLALLEPGGAREFYTIRMEPLKVAHAYGEPMLVRVTLLNTGDLPLTMGPDGSYALRDDFRMDATIGNLGGVAGAASGTIGGTVRLDPGEQVSRIFRLDAGQAGQMIAADPTQPVVVLVSGYTNPVQRQEGTVPGPAGYRQQMRRPMDRLANPLADARQQQELFDQLVRGEPQEKLSALAMLSQYVRIFNQINAQGGDQRDVGPLLQRLVRSRDKEILPAVRAWAGLLLVTLAPPEQAAELANTLVGDGSATVRMAGAVAASTLPRDARGPLLQPLTDDPDPAVARYAAGLLAAPEPEPQADAPAQ